MSRYTASERAARQHMQNRRRRLQAIGQWQSPYVDAEPARTRVRALQAAGMSMPSLTRRLNLPPSALKNLMHGANGRPPGAMVRRETAEALLGFWPSLNDFPDSARIDATGTLRRVQALETLGWSKARQAAEVGQLEQNFKARLRAEKVAARFARSVAALYDRLWKERPEDHGVQGWVAERVRQYAHQRGFHGPLAWDDDTIDDPAAVPLADAPRPAVSDGGDLAARWLLGEAVILTREARREVLGHLFEWTNQTTAEIAEQLDMTPEAAERQWHRIKEKAAADGRRVWRRVYVPRERTLEQNDMEEAA